MPEQINYPNTSRPEINRMAAVSQFLGILSVLSIGFFFFLACISAVPLGLICSNMGILLAHLSKGDGYRFPPRPWSDCARSIFSLVVYILLIF